MTSPYRTASTVEKEPVPMGDNEFWARIWKMVAAVALGALLAIVTTTVGDELIDKRAQVELERIHLEEAKLATEKAMFESMGRK